MPSDIENYLSQIRTAVYGRDVRDAIVNSIEQCYTDTSTGVTAATEAAETAADHTTAAINHMQTMYNALEDGMDTLMDQAESAISDANAAATAAQTAGTALSNNAQDIVIVQQNEPTNKPYNKVWVKPQVTEVEVPTYEEFSDLKSAVTDVENANNKNVVLGAEWAVGVISTVDGSNQTASNRIRTNTYIDISDFEKINFSIGSGYKYYYFIYDSSKVKIADSGAWKSSDVVLTVQPTYKYLRVCVSNTSDTAADVSYADQLTCVTESKLLKKFDALDNRIDDINNKFISDNLIDTTDKTKWTQGDYTSPTSGYKSQSAKIPAVPGDILCLGGKLSTSISSASSAQIYAFFMTSSDTKISHENVTLSDAWNYNLIAVPASTSYIYVIVSTGDSSIRITPDIIANDKPKWYLGHSYIYNESLYRYACDNKMITEIDNIVPDYWVANIDSKIEIAKQKMRTVGGNGDSFVFVTDVHVPNNQLHSPALIKRIIDKTPIRKVICGGDILTSHSGVNKAMWVIDTWMNRLGDVNPVTIRGNHDTNYQGSVTVTDAMFYADVAKYAENSCNTTGKLYYYCDNPSAKIRYIFLDTGDASTITINTTQLNWMKDSITSLDTGWMALIVTHLFFEPSQSEQNLSLSTTGTAIKNAIDDIYSTAGSKLIGVLCGHCHRDFSMTMDNGWKAISTTCDAGGAQATLWDLDNPTRTPGTTLEQAFDIVTIDTTNRRIYMTRVGAGADREYTY